jgi:peptidyl-prolyl cis-trans isomerase SurA
VAQDLLLMSMTKIRWPAVLLIGLVGFSGATMSAPAYRGPTPAPAPQLSGDQNPEIRIAAVVNDEVISVADLQSRLKMVMLSSNFPDSAETRQRIAGQVLRTIVDEKLQMQEAKRQNIAATDDEVKKAISQIEKQNNMQPDQLDALLRAHGIERASLVDQVTASIVWAKLVRRLVSQTNVVSDEEIDDASKRIKESANEPQSRVAEIFLAVDNPQQDEEIRRLAERLIEQMKRGARFSAVAQQFSQSATAAVGGDLGWLRAEQLSPDLAKAVAQMRPGELSPPIRSGAGYYLVLLLDRRTGRSSPDADEAVLHLVQVVFPLPPQASEAMRRAALVEAQNTKTTAKNCAEMLKIGKEKGSAQLSSEGRLRVSQIAPAVRNIVVALEVGQASQPIVQKNGVGVIMVCEKAAPNNTTLPSRDEIADQLARQRAENLARRYLRDLRRSAFVDVRV